MGFDYEELDFQPTELGDLMLRRRRLPQLGEVDIFEVKLGDYFLMSSLYHEAEWQLSKLGLAEADGEELDVVVGGLGLGYTAVSALEDPRVKSLVVVDYLAPVIEWHKKGLVPMGESLNLDERCRLAHGDFFALSRDTSKSFDPREPDKLHDAILLDIDHTPTNVLHQTNTRFYTQEGLLELAEHLKPHGVFALWADGEPEAEFTAHLKSVFPHAEAHKVVFPNPVTKTDSCGAVYVAKKA
ncbi:spermidine synthase [Pelagicoccus albus]|uniref:Spermidine synthase n=1 Tax=Pelagicoccus albus TaxID=415222 RepID=A0A7X1B4K4_9BACT|nr:spermidine synthase [Pelagicoccus albus]MBC2605536.1 spermidine synthase [Pelagicoccus albus]